MKGYLLFHTSSSAFLSEELLSTLEGLNQKMVPTPREYSSDCGMAIWFEYEDVEKVLTLLKSNRVEFELKIVTLS